MDKLYHFNNTEWREVVNKATSRWREDEGLANEPSRADAEKRLGEKYAPHPLTLIALPVFLVLTVLTAFKAILHAAPVAQNFYEGLGDGQALWFPETWLVIAFAATFALMSEVGLVYFVLLSEVVKLPERPTNGVMDGVRWVLDTRTLMVFSVRATVLLILIFLVQISWVAGVSYIDRVLPIVAGLAFSYLVKNLLSEYTKHREKVTNELKTLRARYENDIKDMWETQSFLSALGDIIILELAGLKRKVKVDGRNRILEPNKWLEQADNAVRQRVVVNEYRRHTTGRTMARQLKKEVDSTPESLQEVTAEPHNKLAGVADNSIEIDDKNWWTVEALSADLYSRKWAQVEPEELKRVYKRVHPSTLKKAIADAKEREAA